VREIMDSKYIQELEDLEDRVGVGASSRPVPVRKSEVKAIASVAPPAPRSIAEIIRELTEAFKASSSSE
jgi:hypothetical protein